MKRLEEQNYYQILEVSYIATWGEIQRAYELAKKTYSENAIASYTLFDVKERGRILEKVEEAYQVLGDPDKRLRYNQALKGLIPEEATPPVASPLSSDASALFKTEEQIPEVVTGEMIKAFREKKGLSLEEIAERTRINISYLGFLEVNRFEFLPAEVYVHSYLRQYAQMVQCGEKVVEGYMKGYRSWRDTSKK